MQVEEFIPGREKRVSQKSNKRGEDSPHSLSEHALERMQQRGISHEAVFQTIAFGRISRGRGGNNLCNRKERDFRICGRRNRSFWL